MPIKPVRLDPFWYTPKGEHDENGEPLSNATQFKLRPLTGYELQDVYVDARAGENGNVLFSGTALRNALAAGLVGWKNFADGDGEVPFSSGNPLKNLEYLDFHITAELAAAVLEASTLGANGRKKS